MPHVVPLSYMHLIYKMEQFSGERTKWTLLRKSITVYYEYYHEYMGFRTCYILIQVNVMKTWASVRKKV